MIVLWIGPSPGIVLDRVALLPKKSRMTSREWTFHLYRDVFVNLGVGLCYILVYASNTFIISPLQDAFVPDLSKSVSLLFVPSGLKLFAILAFGEAILPGLLLASLLCDYFFSGIQDIAKLAAVTAVGVGVYYLVIELRLNWA